MKTTLLLVLSLLAGVPAAAQTQTAPPTGRLVAPPMKGAVLVLAKGKCTRFVVASRNYACDKVSYAHFMNGRTAWNFAIPDGAITLAGGRDSQPDPTKYVLEIDHLRTGRSDGTSLPYPAKGNCTAMVSADAKYLHSVSCSATNGTISVQIEFEGDGSPVDRKVM